MSLSTIFFKVGDITDELQYICDKFSIKCIKYKKGINNSDIHRYLVQDWAICVYDARDCITKRNDFAPSFRNSNIIKYLLKSDIERKDRIIFRLIKLVKDTIPINDIGKYVRKYYSVEDKKRIKSINDILSDEKYCLQDVVPQIASELYKISDARKDKINHFNVKFDNLPEEFTDDKLQHILRLIENRYTDFNDIINRTYNTMYNTFTESYTHKMLDTGLPDYLLLDYLSLEGNKLRFKIIVFAAGKGGREYYMSAGKFFVYI